MIALLISHPINVADRNQKSKVTARKPLKQNKLIKTNHLNELIFQIWSEQVLEAFSKFQTKKSHTIQCGLLGCDSLSFWACLQKSAITLPRNFFAHNEQITT